MQSIHHLLHSLDQRQELRSRRQFKQLLAFWSLLVGEAVAAQTRPLSIHRDRLNVATSSAAWAQNLTFERYRLLQKINAQFNLNLQDIAFSSAQWHTVETRGTFSASREIWAQHPSRWEQRPEPAMRGDRPEGPLGLERTPETAFQQWADRIQTQTQTLPCCPQCQSPTPRGELERWQVCALCAAKQW